jgi:hypothetical protein
MLYLSGDHLRVHRRRYDVPYTHHAINFPNGQAVEFGGSTTTSGNTLKFINGDRRKFFEESTMTARHTLEFLSLLDILPFELYRASTQCAKARNDWLHVQQEPSLFALHVSVN